MISLHPFTSVSVIQRIQDSDVAYSVTSHLLHVRACVLSVLSVWPTMSILIIHFCNAIPLISISIFHIHHISLLLIVALGAKLNLKWKLNSNAVFESIWSTKAFLKLPDWPQPSLLRADRISTPKHFKLDECDRFGNITRTFILQTLVINFTTLTSVTISSIKFLVIE